MDTQFSAGIAGDIITNFEAEHMIENLIVFEINDYGCQKWYRQDEFLQKINMQAHVNALMKSDEFIMDTCVTYDKVKVLIYDLICTEVWKQQVLPLLKKDIINQSSFKTYMAIYHEAVICNLLEVILYHRTAVDNADNYLLEMIDYCYRKLLYLLKFPQTKQAPQITVEQILKKTKEEEFQEQLDDIEFKIAMMCLSLIRYISDYVRFLPLGIVHHLLVETDILCLLVPLIEDKPWLRKTAKGEREIFEQSKWQIIDKSEYSKLPKIEAQVWISIYNLFMDPECRKKYDLTDFRKSNMLRLRKFMNEILLDQIPNLTQMLRQLEELSIMQTPSLSLSNPFVVQQMPEIRQAIMKGKNWKEIAEYQKKNFFVDDPEQAKQDMLRLAELYGQNLIDGLIDGFTCQQCKKSASKRCSRCKQVWYCSKDCQLAHWKEHKVACQNFVAMQEKKKEQDKQKDEQKGVVQQQSNLITELPKNEEKVQINTEDKPKKKDLEDLD